MFISKHISFLYRKLSKKDKCDYIVSSDTSSSKVIFYNLLMKFYLK